MTWIRREGLRVRISHARSRATRESVHHRSAERGTGCGRLFGLVLVIGAFATASQISYAADQSSANRGEIVVAQNTGGAASFKSRSQTTLRAHKASKLRGWQQLAIMELLLASLGIDPEKKIETVKRLQKDISQVIRGTRFGDEALNLRAATDKDVLDALGVIEAEWAQFNNALNPMLESGEMSAERVGALVELSLPLLAASQQLADKAEIAEGNRRRTYTVLVSTISYATNHAMLSHRALTEFLLIARGYKVDLTKIKLARSVKEFDEGLKALISGSDKHRVLAAPTAEVKDQYAVVQRIWKQLLPVLQAAAGPGSAGSGALQTVAQGMSLSRELDRALELYHKL